MKGIKLEDYIECFRSIPREEYSVLEKAMLTPLSVEGVDFQNVGSGKFLGLSRKLPGIYKKFEKAEALKTEFHKYNSIVEEMEGLRFRDCLVQNPSKKLTKAETIAVAVPSYATLPLVIAGVIPWFLSLLVFIPVGIWQQVAGRKYSKNKAENVNQVFEGHTKPREELLQRLEEQIGDVRAQMGRGEMSYEEAESIFLFLEKKRRAAKRSLRALDGKREHAMSRIKMGLNRSKVLPDEEPTPYFGLSSVIPTVFWRYPKKKWQYHHSRKRAGSLEKELEKQRQSISKSVANLYKRS